MTGVPRPEAAAARGGVLARLEAGLVRANRWVVIALVAVMAVLVFANVVARYAFSYSFVWAEEVTRYMMVWVGFIGSGLVLRYGAHIAVEAFQDVLPARAAQATRALVVLILAVSFAAMTWLGVQYVLFAWDQETPILNWNFGLVYLAVPLGSALMLVHLLCIARPYILARKFDQSETFNPEDAVL
ncbi:MAG: TRAP transporter small permease [Rhodocyclaceae bacterium]|nr:TRAP transporter small permease [Rhodocyclaceae bacterium]